MTDILDGFDERSDRLEDARGQRLRAAMLSTGAVDPAAAARANALSDKTGTPFGVVAENLADYEQQDRLDRVAAVGGRSPVVGDFLSDPRRMALAGDEAEKVADYANSLVTGEVRPAPEPNILEQVIGGIVSGWQRGKANALSLLPDGPAVMDPATGRLTTDRSAEEAALRADQERRAQAADLTSASTERGFQAFDRANKAGSFGGAVRELAGGGTDTLGAIAVTLGQSIGMGAPGLALTAATGGGSRVLTAASAGTGSGLTEFGASIAEAMQDAKVDPTDAYAVGQFLRDPQKMAAAREKAAKRGVAIGVFDALTAGVAGHFINNARRSASSAVLRTGAEAGVQLGGGAAGEATAQLLTEDRLKWGDIIMEGLAEIPTGAIEIHANYRAARASGQVRWINERLDQVMRSGDSNERLRAATELAADLKLGDRSPEDMKALTAQVAGEDARVYLDAEQAQVLFQSAPQVLQDMVGGESALAEQLATGQIVIPVAEWMAAVPRLPNRDQILRNARTTADGLSPAELETLDVETMARELGVPLDAPAPDPAAATARAQVQQSVMAQLVGTERYTAAQAESQAQLWGAMFGRLGEVTGQDPVALYERYAAGIYAAEAPAEGAEAQPRTLMQRGMDALRSLFGRPQVVTDGRGQQTLEREGNAYVQRAGQWLLADEQGQARDFLTLDQARTEAERTGGEIVQDDPIEGQRQTWSVALPDTAAREVLAGDILFQPAFHGTPYHVDRFSVQRIGTGEGNQAFGWGMYFAGRREVADYYAQAVSRDRRASDEALGSARDALREALRAEDFLGFDTFGEAVGALLADARWQQNWDISNPQQLEQSLEAYRSARDALQGKLYQVDVPDDADLLNWDAPFSQQPDSVQQAVRRVTAGEALAESLQPFEDTTGDGIYRAIVRDLGSPQAASEALMAAGVPGLRYLDGSSRRAGDGSHNYVIWDEAAVGEPLRLYQPSRTDEVPTGLAPDTPVPVIELEPTTGNPAEWFAESNELLRTEQDGLEVIAPDGQPVRFASRGRKKVLSKGRRDPLRHAVVRQLPALVESAPVHATSVDTEDKSVSYAYAASAVLYDGQVYPVRLVYRVGTDGVRRSYDFEGFEIGNPDGLGNESLRQSGSDVGAMERAGTAESELRTRGLPTSALTLAEVLPAFNGRAFFQPSEAAPRGQIKIGPDRSMQISLFRGSDLSTFLHESGHFFLEVYRDLAAAEDAAPQIRSDLDTLLKWFGVESADQIGVDQHEQFARGFEAYLGEGRAPTPELQSVFSQFKQWILGLYRSLRNLDVELTDEVRGVFDRMLASQEEIEAAQARAGFEPIARDLAEAQALGMTERQFVDYQAQVAAARDQAEADLMAQLQDADARARERWWKDERAALRAEVQAEVESTPIVRAYRVLTGRKEAGGEPVPEQLQGMKLDKAALVSIYGDGQLDKLGRVYARNGGVHPDEAAALLGFSSGDELVQSLWTVQHTLAAVEVEAEARMRARHGDPMTDGTLPQRALDAVHGSRKIQLLERELGLLADLAREPRPNRRELKAVAQTVLARKTARQLRPNEYLVAERKAARAATEAAAKGRYAEALQAKRQQALNAVLFAEARAIQQEVDSKVGYIRRQMTPQARERLGKAGADYLEAMDTIADTYEFRDVSGRAVARRQSLRQWVEARQADDDLTAVSDALLARVEAENVTNYADLPITEFRELHDAVVNIARLAKLKNQLLSNKDQRGWEEAQAELAGAIRGAIAEGKPLPFSDADMTAMQKVGAAYTGLMDWVLRPETVVEWLDGGETGPWHDYLWNQAEAAQQKRIELRNRVGGMLEQTMKALTPAQRADLNRHVYVPSLGRSLSKNTIVAVALNLGNAGNRDKLMRGGYIGKNAEVVPFTPQAISEMLGHLTPADAQMVQGIWDAVNSLWPDIVEQQRRLSGVAPEQVEPMPLIFTAADGSMVSLRGGYYPAVYDPRAGAGGVKQARAAEEQIMGGTFSRAMTSKGHTKERTDYAAPMLLDYHRVLSRHLNDVITDVSHRGYVKQALRVLEDQELKNLIQQRLSEGAYHALYGSVKNSVRGASVSEPGSSMAEKIGDAVLTNTAVAALGFRLPLVFANTVVAPIQAAARVDPKYLAFGYAAYYRSPGKMTEMIHSLSPFMEERANSLDSSYQVVLGKLSGKRGIRAAAMKMAMEVHRWTVPLAERAIWLGRYQQAQSQGAGVDEAVRLADKAIRTTQQAGAPKDLSAAERDPRYKWVRMFIGPMIIMNNRLQESGLRGLYLGRVQSPARALGTWLSAGVLSNAVFELLMMRGPDGGDDDEKGWDDWSAWLARKTLLFPLQTIPLLRDVAGGIDAAIEGKPSMGRPNPIVDAGVALAKFGEAAWKEGRDWIADDAEPDAEKLIKTGVRAAGPLTGIPSNQMLTTGEYLYDVSTGQYTPDNPAEAAAYLMYRRPKDEQ